MQQLDRKIYLIFVLGYKEILVYYTKGKDSNTHAHRYCQAVRTNGRLVKC